MSFGLGVQNLHSLTEDAFHQSVQCERASDPRVAYRPDAANRARTSEVNKAGRGMNRRTIARHEETALR